MGCIGARPESMPSARRRGSVCASHSGGSPLKLCYARYASRRPSPQFAPASYRRVGAGTGPPNCTDNSASAQSSTTALVRSSWCCMAQISRTATHSASTASMVSTASSGTSAPQAIASSMREAMRQASGSSAAMMSEVHLLDGNPEVALAEVDEALVVSARTGEAWFDAELHRCRGCALVRLGPGEARRTERELRCVLGVAHSQSALLFELRTARPCADAARLRWDRRGDPSCASSSCCTIAWLNRCRRSAKDWECLNRRALAFLRWASVRRMLQRLCQKTI